MIEPTTVNCPRCLVQCDWFVIRPQGNEMPLADLLAAAPA